MIWNVNGIWLISSNRFLNVQSTLAVLVPMVSSPRTVTTLTSLLPRSLELRARRLRFSCDSRLSRVAVVVRIWLAMFMALRLVSTLMRVTSVCPIHKQFFLHMEFSLN